MQKKIIVLAIAAAFSAPAFADTANVTVYGAVNMAVESISTGEDVAGNAGARTNKVSSNVTKLGLKGSEDLGDGLSAIWQIESQIDGDNSTGTLGSRNTFVGLSSKDAGTVLAGKHDTPYKISTRALDVFGDSIADNRSLMGGVGATFKAVTLPIAPGVTVPTNLVSISNSPTAVATFDGRQGNVLAYISPSLGGMTVAAAYVMGAEDATAATKEKGSAMSLAAMYTMDNLYASAAYEVHKFGNNGSGNVAGPKGLASSISSAMDLGGTKESAIKFAVGYKMDALTLNAVYEKTKDDLAVGAPDTNVLGHTALYLAAKYNMDANNAVKVAYTKAGKTNSADTAGLDDSASQVSLGFDHAMSKRTSVFALYTAINNGDDASYGLTTGGSTGGQATTGPGAKISAFAVGMKHAF